jgi:GNAT superfamily N-acetyltransferase
MIDIPTVPDAAPARPSHTLATDPGWRVRAATQADVPAIAALWHSGWRDGHVGHVPADLHAHRDLDSFVQRVPPRIAGTTIATHGDAVAGFVMVVDDELEQIYIAAESRGSGVAAVLLAAAEQHIADRFDTAWLAVVAGNQRARRFYARHGWRDAGPIDYVAETLAGPFVVPSHRYEKHLVSAASQRR